MLDTVQDIDLFTLLTVQYMKTYLIHKTTNKDIKHLKSQAPV